jgi:hypothetical protein
MGGSVFRVHRPTTRRLATPSGSMDGLAYQEIVCEGRAAMWRSNRGQRTYREPFWLYVRHEVAPIDATHTMAH